MDTELKRLRAELEGIDTRILELVAERARRASAIGKVKREAGRPTRDFRRERDVIERARATAEKLELPPRLAEELMLLLIRSALEVQEKQGLVTAKSGSGKRALVIGGSGKMGRWFVRFLASQGFEVEIADPEPFGDKLPQIKEWQTSNLDQDVIVLATPLVATGTILAEMAKRPPPGLVFDIGSLKSPLRDGLLALAGAGARVTSIHPMFGPDTELLSGRHVIFVDVGDEEATREARELFASTMAEQVAMDLESHDRSIAYVLGLSHALNIAFVTALVESGEAAPALARLSSTTFDEQLAVARKVTDDNPRLYFEIQSLNDYGSEALAALLYAVERLRSVVLAGDERGFAALMERGQEYFGVRDG